jgi:hypothetical protein
MLVWERDREVSIPARYVAVAFYTLQVTQVKNLKQANGITWRKTVESKSGNGMCGFKMPRHHLVRTFTSTRQ